MTVKVAQLFLDVHDVFDADFRARFPDYEFVRVRDAEGLARALPGARVLMINNQSWLPEVGRAVAAHGAGLEWIQFMTVGIDTPVKNGLPKGPRLSNVRSVRTPILAGHAVALMLGVMRGFHYYEKFRARGEWARMEMFDAIQGPEGLTLAIVGMGEIGEDVARKAKAFEMNVIAVTRRAELGPCVDEVVPRERFRDILPRVDVVLMALPYDETTHHFLGAAELALMKPTAIVVNISRGGVIDEAALIRALTERRIAGAGLDVTEVEPLPPASPLWRLDNVLISPHVAGRGGLGQTARLRELIAENLCRFRDGRPLLNEVEWGSGAQVRLDPAGADAERR